MKVRKITKDDYGNCVWDFGHGFTSYVSGQTAIGQDIYCSLLEWKNNCFFALQNGIDWRTRLGQKNQKEQLDEDVLNIIASREGVLDIQDFVSNVIDRVYTCQCNVFTIYSENFNFTFSNEV